MIHDGSIGAALNSILSAFPGFARKSVYPRFVLSRCAPATATNVATNVRKQIVIRRKFLAIAIGWTPRLKLLIAQMITLHARSQQDLAPPGRVM
jgi:hypothetical protein